MLGVAFLTTKVGFLSRSNFRGIYTESLDTLASMSWIPVRRDSPVSAKREAFLLLLRQTRPRCRASGRNAIVSPKEGADAAMKFGKQLRIQIEETLPVWRNKFLSYKELKKRLKSLGAPPVNGVAEVEPRAHPSAKGCESDTAAGNGENFRAHCEGGVRGPEEHGQANVIQAAAEEDSDDSLEDLGSGRGKGDGKASNSGDDVRESGMPQLANGRHITAEEQREFIRLLNCELEKFNEFFMEKEEDYVILLECLKERLNAVNEASRLLWGSECPPEVMAIRRDVVGFHGEMVLLLNYSSLNFMGLLKILKKYDKRMLTNLQSSFIRTVSGQPFIATDMLTKLIAQCEKILEMVLPPPLHPGSEGQASADAAPGDRLGMGMGVGIRAGGEGGAALDGEGGRKKPRVGRDTEDVSGDSTSAAQAMDAMCPEEEDEAVNSIYRSTLAALKTLKDMKAGGAGAAEAGSRDAENGNGNGSGLSCLSKGLEEAGSKKEDILIGGDEKGVDESGQVDKSGANG